MAKQTAAAAQGASQENIEKLQDILLLHDKLGKMLHAVTGMDGNGKPETTPYDEQKNNSFLKLDKMSSVVENFWKNFVDQFKDPTRYTGELPSKEYAERLYTRIAACSEATVMRSERKSVSQAPPLLYDLTTLQKDCNVRFGMSPEQTLEAAQTLYERKLITYPRTGSRHIPADVMKTVPALIGRALAIPAFAHMKESIDLSALSTGSVDGGKVTDHHALLTTGIDAGELSETEERVYALIVGRMLEAFAPECRKETLTMEIMVDGERFESSSSAVTSPGWRDVLHRGEEETEDRDDEDDGTAVFGEGETATIGGCGLAGKKTRPRPLYTEATLLTAMEQAGKEVVDDAAREALRDCGLGTPATRAAIIATLFRREYIVRKGKSLLPTEKGIFIYEATKNMRIADARLTGEWEHALSCIEAGEMSMETFLEAIRGYTKEVTAEILSLDFPGSQGGSIPCPKCGKGHVAIMNKVAKCNDPACGLVVFRRFLNRELSDHNLQQLLMSGKTSPIKGFKGKDGKTFDAKLTFDDSFRLTFVPGIAKSAKSAKAGNRAVKVLKPKTGTKFGK